MMLSLLVTACSTIAVAPAMPAPISNAGALTPPAAQDQNADKIAEWQKKLTDAGTDTVKLFEVADWCKENKLRKEQRETYKKILEIDKDNEKAHNALRHHHYDGQWFETYAALSVYKRDEAKRMEEQGLTKVGDQWVPIAEAPFLRMGWEKGEDGVYRSKVGVERAKAEKEFADKGWQQHYGIWVAPEDFPKIEQGLYRCGEEWLEKEAANEFHGKIYQWWQVPGENFVINSTCDHDTSTWARHYADQTFPHLVKLYGVQPDGKPTVTVLNSLAQYNLYAGGDQQTVRGVEANGYSSCHFAFFAELQFKGSIEAPEPDQGGVAFWDTSDPNLAPFGQYASRHAAALSYAEAVDPSWDAVSRFLANPGGGQFPEAAFWAEKQIPRWMRYGAASYCERYLPDTGTDNPWAFRSWAIQNLLSLGEMDPLPKIFEFQLDPTDATGKLISEAGLLVSFMLDGDNAAVRQAHAKFKSLLKQGEDTTEAVQELQQAIIDNQEALQAYVKSIQG